MLSKVTKNNIQQSIVKGQPYVYKICISILYYTELLVGIYYFCFSPFFVVNIHVKFEGCKFTVSQRRHVHKT